MSDPTVEDGAFAATLPATRRSLRHRWAAALALVVVTVILLCVSAVIARADAQRLALQQTGVRASGTVVALDVTPTGRTGFTDGSVQVQFPVTGQSAPTQTWIYVAGRVSSYQTGQSVEVVYDPSDPSRAQLAGVTTPPQGVPLGVPLILGGLLLVMTIVVTRHAARITRVLRRERWESVTCEVTALTAKGAMARVVADLQTSKGHKRVSAVGLSHLDESFTPVALVAGLDSSLMVLAQSDGSRVVGVRGGRPAKARRS